jgi:hypothetical protein
VCLANAALISSKKATTAIDTTAPNKIMALNNFMMLYPIGYLKLRGNDPLTKQPPAKAGGFV